MTPVSEKLFFGCGSLNLFELQTKCKKLTPIQKMSSSQSCSHRNSVQNAPIEKFTALTVTLFVKNHKFDPDPKTIVIITKLIAPKFCAECTDRELHSSHGDPFREKTEIVTKIVPVRAVNMPIGAFCTEFRCERFCDDDVFRNRGRQKVAVTVT